MFTFFISVPNIKILNYFKKKLHVENVECQIFINRSLLIQTLRISLDFLIYKTILDIMLCTPYVIILLTGSFNLYVIILSYICWIAYIIIFGNLLLLIDHSNKVKISSKVKYLFLSKLFHIKIGNNMSYNIYDSNRLIPTITNRLNVDTTSNFLTNKTLNDLTEDSEVDDKFIHHTKKDFSPLNFFLNFKLLYAYYKANEKFYERIENKAREVTEVERASLDKMSLKSGDSKFSFQPNQTNKNNTDPNILVNIQNVINSEKAKIIKNLNCKFSQLFNNLEDKDIKEQFERTYLSKSQQSKIETQFTIETYFSEDLDELYPLFQVHFKDILKSLDADRNKSIIKILYEKKVTDENFNLFYTYDNFLCLEFCQVSLLPTLLDFIKNYQTFIKTRFFQWKQTFLPLILGVFKISYLDYEKLIILSRHPLAFSSLYNFKYWININLHDLNEKVSLSSGFAEVVDLKEIEIKDKIYLHTEDHQEILGIFEQDINFLNSINYYNDMNLNIFLLNDKQNFLSTLGGEKEVEHDDNSSKDFLQALRKTENFRVTVIKNLEKKKTEYGSDMISMLDKIVTNYVINSRLLIKIYFTNLFQTCIKDEGKKHFHLNLSAKEHNEKLRVYLKESLIKIIKCSSAGEDSVLDKTENNLEYKSRS